MPDDQGPLLLHEVLEEEFISLHGALPDAHYKDETTGKDKTSEERLKDIYDRIHNLDVPQAALCISGGGIRSATFALGIIQGLARLKWLDKFHYLSTVSGGGYIGSWLSSWIHRDPKGPQGVFEQLEGDQPTSVLEPEAEPIRHLRNYSNYLSPKLGLLSADTWTLVAIIVRNLILNWTVFIPLLAAALLVPRIYVALIHLLWSDGNNESKWLTGFIIAAFLAGVVAVAYMGALRPTLKKYQSQGLRRWADQGGFLWLCLLPSVGLAFLLTIYWAWLREPGTEISQQVTPIFGLPIAYPWPFLLFGLMVHLVACVIFMIWLKRFKLWELGAAVVVGLAGGALLWAAATQVFPLDHKAADIDIYACFALPLILGLLLLAVTLFVGVASTQIEDEDREWLARYGAWMLIAMVGWSAVGVIVIFGPGLLLSGTQTAIAAASAGGISGLITILFGRSADTAANNKQAAEGKQSSVKNIALALAAPIFIIIFLMAMSLGTSALILPLEEGFKQWMNTRQGLGQITPLQSLDNHLHIIDNSSIYVLLALFVAFLLIGLLMAWFININKFSLHAMYRNRIIRAYLGASRTKRDENPFTGFDPDDNLPLHELRLELFHASSFADARRFVEKLATDETELSKYVYQRLSETLKPKPEAAVTEPSFSMDTFIRAMNGVIDGDDSLYQEAWFPEITFSQEINILRKQPLTPNTRTILNRLIIDFIYKDHVTPFREHRPLHVVNMALNLVRGNRLAWQQRKAESFTASPLHSGSCFLTEETVAAYGNYRRSKEYGGSKEYGDQTKPQADATQGITLGTAVAISGAAVSPNMGYHSSPALTFLLTLFNARLGWWLGNPGRAGDKTYRYASPKLSIRPLIAEALGLTDDKNKYIYLSDGGHFENLALYEMVLRRCRYIIVSDGSADPDYVFDDLGAALRKIRIDFGIPITIDKLVIRSRSQAGAFCAIGKIGYSKIDGGGDQRDGTLIYIKPAFYEAGPTDVFNYAQQSKTFPHETTADQFFSESQFESYRRLGAYVLETIFKSNFQGRAWSDFKDQCDVYLEPF
jgi:hypothetical protein